MYINRNKSINPKTLKVLEDLPELPSMPAVVSRAIEMLDDPNTNLNQLSDILSKDVAITLQILKLVNSAYYSFPTRITTINKALALLGFNSVKSLIMSVAMKPMMMSYAGRSLWVHSIRCAVGARHIAKSLRYGDPDEVFIMGLLHDIGKTIMLIKNKDAYPEVQKLVDIGADVLETERTFYGFTHAEVGRALVEKWNLPLMIGITAEHHHNPLGSQEVVGTSIIYVSDRICQEKLKYPIFKQEIIDSLDYEISDPETLRQEVFEMSQLIIDALS